MTPLVARITLHVQRTCALLLRLSSLDSLESIVTHFSMSRQGPKLPYPLFSALPRESIRVLLMSGIHRHVLIGTSFSLLFYRSGMPSGRRARGACARPFFFISQHFSGSPCCSAHPNSLAGGPRLALAPGIRWATRRWKTRTTFVFCYSLHADQEKDRERRNERAFRGNVDAGAFIER